MIKEPGQDKYFSIMIEESGPDKCIGSCLFVLFCSATHLHPKMDSLNRKEMGLDVLPFRECSKLQVPTCHFTTCLDQAVLSAFHERPLWWSLHPVDSFSCGAACGGAPMPLLPHPSHHNHRSCRQARGTCGSSMCAHAGTHPETSTTSMKLVSMVPRQQR